MELNISNPPATQVPLTAAMIGLYTGKRCRTAWIASSLSREESGYFRLHPASPRRSAASRCQMSRPGCVPSDRSTVRRVRWSPVYRMVMRRSVGPVPVGEGGVAAAVFLWDGAALDSMRLRPVLIAAIPSSGAFQ